MTTEKNLPIGYWLKQADKIISEKINQAQAVHGVSRTEWQILNLLKENGRVTRETVCETMQPFADIAQCQEIINHLVTRGWVNEAHGSEDLQLSEVGQHQQERILATQREVRQQAMQGISEDEYATVLRVLRQMVENLHQSA